jgi:hypothetical protein
MSQFTQIDTRAQIQARGAHSIPQQSQQQMIAAAMQRQSAAPSTNQAPQIEQVDTRAVIQSRGRSTIGGAARGWGSAGSSYQPSNAVAATDQHKHPEQVDVRATRKNHRAEFEAKVEREARKREIIKQMGNQPPHVIAAALERELGIPANPHAAAVKQDSQLQQQQAAPTYEQQPIIEQQFILYYLPPHMCAYCNQLLQRIQQTPLMIQAFRFVDVTAESRPAYVTEVPFIDVFDAATQSFSQSYVCDDAFMFVENIEPRVQAIAAQYATTQAALDAAELVEAKPVAGGGGIVNAPLSIQQTTTVVPTQIGTDVRQQGPIPYKRGARFVQCEPSAAIAGGA